MLATPATVEVATRANVALDPMANAMLASTASTGIIELATAATVEAAPTANVALQLATAPPSGDAEVAAPTVPPSGDAEVAAPSSKLAVVPRGHGSRGRGAITRNVSLVPPLAAVDVAPPAAGRGHVRSHVRGRQPWTIGPSLPTPPTGDVAAVVAGAATTAVVAGAATTSRGRGQGRGRRGRGARRHRGKTLIIKKYIFN
jgi:hypothetical protein